MNPIIKRDMKEVINNSNIDFTRFKGKTILISGATGLIGKNIICALVEANRQLHLDIRIDAQVRNVEKAKKIFKDYGELRFIVGDVRKPLDYTSKVDYIIHTACQTSSREFISEPVDVLNTSIIGTMNLLEFAKEKNVSGFVYLSSMEVYGTPSTDEKIDETHGTDLNTMKVRSCYPESKRLCEMLCTSYNSQYHVPTKVVRLTQTFGPGVAYDDGRVFAEFARCAIEGKDIVLHTKGETRRSYLYTADAVTAILTVLLDGESGQAYNAANEDTYCSVYEMAEMVSDIFSKGKSNVVVEEMDGNTFGYAPVLRMNLETAKLKRLGWNPVSDLLKMFDSLIGSMETES